MILWIRICKIHDKLIFSKCHYIEKILDKFNKNENNIVKTSIYVNLLLYKDIGDAISQDEYSHAIRGFIHLINYIRPDIVS